jgi:60 kDa SS-A/Ro ribonucleoprotein
MKSSYSTVSQKLNPIATPQTEPIPGKTMIQNHAGGYGFEVSIWQRLERFLILGSENGNYYIGKLTLTLQNAQNVSECIKVDGKRTVDVITAISDSGRAAKNDPALFALAMCASAENLNTRTYALQNLSKIARIGTHLFHFTEYINNLRGWSRSLRTAMSNWYLEKPAEKLALQLTKYQSRDGWSHRDILRLAHPTPKTEAQRLGFMWSVGLLDKYKDKNSKHFNEELYQTVMGNLVKEMPLIAAYEDMKSTDDEAMVIHLIKKFQFPLELVPTEKRTKAVYDAIIPNLKIEALIRELPTLTRAGVLGDLGNANSDYIVGQLTNFDTLRRGRVHPFKVLLALSTYRSGQNFRGTSSWTPVSKISSALEDAFYLSFGAVEPTNKRIMLALDVSGSMSMGSVLGSEQLRPCEVTSVMAMVTARTEKDCMIMGFSDRFKSLNITSKDSLKEVLHNVAMQKYGGTDCSLPMNYARENKLPVDAFVVYTDNETWAGGNHPIQALKQYQQVMGIPAKLISIATSTNHVSIADESSYTTNVCGFDSAAPQIINDFITN